MAAFVYDMTDTWNNSGTTFTAIKMNITNTASAAASKFLDVQSGGSSVFQIMKETSRGGTGIKITAETPNSQIVEITPRDAGTGLAIYSSGGAPQIFNGLIGAIGITCFATLFGNEAKLFCDGANILAQRNDTNAQTLRVYNTYTDASNYERLSLGWSSNVLTLASEVAGTGTMRDVAVSGAKDGFWGVSFSNLTNVTGINGAVYTDWKCTASSALVHMTLSSGRMSGTNRCWLGSVTGDPFNIIVANATKWEFQPGGSLGPNTTGTGGAPDVAFARNGAGVMEVNNGTAGTLRDLRARNVRTEPTTVASLIAAATAGAGARSFVTDATATTFLTTVAGGGSNAVPVVSNGTNWLIG